MLLRGKVSLLSVAEVQTGFPVYGFDEFPPVNYSDAVHFDRGDNPFQFIRPDGALEMNVILIRLPFTERSDEVVDPATWIVDVDVNSVARKLFPASLPSIP